MGARLGVRTFIDHMKARFGAPPYREAQEARETDSSPPDAGR